MKYYTAKEIDKLQNNLSTIRKAGGWSAEEFGEMIGVTKQTISNLENKRTAMSKTQYIAIRAVLDYEMTERPDDTVLSSTINLYLNSDGLSQEDVKKAQAFVEGGTKNGLDKAAIIGGLTALIGGVTLEAVFLSEAVGTWIAKIIKEK